MTKLFSSYSYTAAAASSLSLTPPSSLSLLHHYQSLLHHHCHLLHHYHGHYSTIITVTTPPPLLSLLHHYHCHYVMLSRHQTDLQMVPIVGSQTYFHWSQKDTRCSLEVMLTVRHCKPQSKASSQSSGP